MPIDPKQLCHVTLLEGMSPEQLALIAERCRARPYKAETTIVNQDDPGETLYIILNGIVKVTMNRPDGKEVFLAVLSRGDHFGELSLIDSKYRSANVETQEETTLLMIDRAMFEQLMTMPPFPHNLCRCLAARFRRGNERIGNLARMSVGGLVAHHIVEFAELYGQTQPNGKDILIPIRLTQNDLADLVGASRERVNQVIKHFKDKRFISVNMQYRITVHNLAQLRKCVEMQ